MHVVMLVLWLPLLLPRDKKFTGFQYEAEFRMFFHYHFWGCAIAQTDNYILLWKDTGAGFFHIALVIIILSPFICTSCSLFPEVCGSPDKAAHYHILVQKSVSNILNSTSKHIVPLLKQWLLHNVSSSVHELWNKCTVILTLF